MFRDVLAWRVAGDPRSRRLQLMLATAFFNREPVADLDEDLAVLRADGVWRQALTSTVPSS